MTASPAALQTILSGGVRPLESASLANGSSLCAEWTERRKALEQSKQHLEGRIPWELFSDETLSWYASKLPPSQEDKKTVAQSRLLDSRDHLTQTRSQSVSSSIRHRRRQCRDCWAENFSIFGPQRLLTFDGMKG